jgi:hypothetical protein
MNKRTCPMKHHCERSAWVSSYRRPMEKKYEVWDTQANLDPEWDDPDTNEHMVFTSDDKSECEAFIANGAQRCELRENGVCLVCDMYDKRKVDLAEGRVQPFYIVAYGISRHYGGPEEGGWYYNWTDVHEVRRVFTVQEGIRQMRQLSEKYPQPRFDRYSCANQGEDDNYFVLCYGEQDPRWPKQSTHRPRYE